MVTSAFVSLWLVFCSWVGIKFWRFPIPFHVTLVYVLGFVGFGFIHCLVFRTRLQESAIFRKRIVAYLPCIAIYTSQMTIYQAYSAAYHASDEWLEVVLTLLFPLIKYALKMSIRMVSDPILEQSDEMIVGSIAIAATMYQSMIMQSTPSVIVTVLIIGVDVVQSIVEIRHMMDKQSVVTQDKIIATAINHLELSGLSDKRLEKQLSSYGSLVKTTRRMILPGSVAPELIDNRRVTSGASQSRKIATRDPACGREDSRPHAGSRVAIFLLWLAPDGELSSAVYNLSIAEFYFHPGRLVPALLSLSLYIGLQVLSFLVVALVMRVRFQLSPLPLLAFHLERYAWSFQGKLVSWFSLLLQFSLLHYGTDFSFRFGFHVPTADDYP